MLQVRKLVLAVAAATALTSNMSYALGLGNLAVKSSLNQPLEAEISLLEVRNLTSVEIKTQLASPEDFTKAGLERQFFLTGLTFTPVVGADGKHVIRVTSSKPVKEPYLSFLVEVLWPNGRLLREYTLLLDPPLYKPQQVIQAAQPAQIAASQTAIRTTRPVAQEQRQAAAKAAPAVNQTGKVEYRVQKNDTLWGVAERVDAQGTVQQRMLAIQDLNPSAFIGSNINRMKSGQVLTLPSAEDVSKRSHTEAMAQVADQVKQWKGRRTATAYAASLASVDTAPELSERQIDARLGQVLDVAPRKIESSDSLRLLSGTPGDAEHASDQGAAAALSLQDQLALSKERLDSVLLENEDLNSRIDDLSSQLDKLQRLIELKDNQLAQLQNAVDQPAAMAVAVTPSSDTDTDSRLEATVDTAETPRGAATLEEADADAEQTPQDSQAAAATDSEVVAQSFFDKMMSSPLQLAAVGGSAVLALLLLLMAASRSRARKEAERYSETLMDEDLAQTGLVDPVAVASGVAAGSAAKAAAGLDRNIYDADEVHEAQPSVEPGLEPEPEVESEVETQAASADQNLELESSARVGSATAAVSAPSADTEFDSELDLDDLTIELNEPHDAAPLEPGVDLAAEFDFSDLALDEPQVATPATDFDQVNQELEALSISLGDDELTEAAVVETELTDFDFEGFDLTTVNQTASAAGSASALDELNELAGSEDDLSFLSGGGHMTDKLDLARTYLSMNDVQAAREALDQVLAEGTAEQQEQARQLIDKLA